MKYVFAILTFLSSFCLTAQDFRGFVDHVDSLPSMSERQDAVDSFMNVITPLGIPYISNDTAYFVYKGNTGGVMIAGDFNGWNPGAGFAMEQVADTDLWYKGLVFELHARLDYKLVVDGNWILDPLNPNLISGGFGPNSELAMPDYVQPWEIEYIGGAGHGSVTSDVLSSTQTASSFQLKIYLPFGYDANNDFGYPVAYFQDGQESIDLGKAVNVIDNLIDAGEIDDIIAVFVVPNDRGTEYAGNLREEYVAFFTETLVSYIDGNYNTAAVGSHRAVIGASLGGNISALISYEHPEVFANCGIHSGALWPNGNEVYNLIVNGSKKDIKFASVWGSYESLDGQMTSLKDHFITEGYELEWSRLPEGYSWGLWRSTFDEFLKFFFNGLPSVTPVRESLTDDQVEIYFDSNQLHYHLDLKQQKRHSIRLIDMSGKTMFKECGASDNMVKGSIGIGNYPSGIYTLIVESKDGIYSGKVSIVH